MPTEAPPKPASDKPPTNTLTNFMSQIKTDLPDPQLSPQPAAEPVIDSPPAPEPNPAPAKPDPSKPEPAPDDKPEPMPRDSRSWKAYKEAETARRAAVEKERDAIRTERDAVKAEIETLRKQGPSPELEGLKKERDQLSEQLRLVAVTEHPKFKAHFENKVTAQLELARRIVGAERADAIVQVLKQPDGPYKDQQLEEIANDLTMTKQAQLGSVITGLASIQQERDSEVAKAKENYSTMTAQQEAQTKQAQQQRVAAAEKAFNDTVAMVSDPKDGLFPFQKRDGDDKWNSEVQHRIESAKSLMFGKAEPEMIAKASLQAAMLPTALQALEEVTKERDTLKTQVKSMTTASPAIRQGSPPSNGNAPGSSPLKPLGQRGNPRGMIADWMKTNPAIGVETGA